MRATLGMPWPSVDYESNVCAEAAKAGHLDVLKLARAQGCPWDASTCIAAARHGHLHILQWARRHGCAWDLRSEGKGYYADFYGDEGLTHPTLTRTAAAAAAGGHLHLLVWATKNGCKCMDDVCEAAALEGHLDVLAWAAERQVDWNNGRRVQDTIRGAISNGRILILQWLLERLGSTLLRETWRQTELSPDSWAFAIRRIELLQWGRDHAGADFASPTLCSLAAQHCCLDTLQWLRQQGCPWDAETAARACSSDALEIQAASDSALDLLRWARTNGCPWDERTCEAAGAHGATLQLLDYLKTQECPGADKVCLAASEHAHLHTLKCAREVGFPWDPAECEERARDPRASDKYPEHAEIVQWIQEQRREVGATRSEA